MFDRFDNSNYNIYKALSHFVIGKEAILVKSTGIVRKVDELGRIVLPIELRRHLDIEERDSLEIYMDGDKIVLKKYALACVFCGSDQELLSHKGKNVCAACVRALNK